MSKGNYTNAIRENKISVSMIVKNEEVMLLDCLNSIKQADEIIIVDTGSEDDTTKVIDEFAKMYKGNLIRKNFKWIYDFSAARNESLKYCTKDWVLIIDADETIEKGGINMIKRRIKHVTTDIVRINVKTDMEEFTSPRVFKNNKAFKWHRAAHNILMYVNGDEIPSEYGDKLSILIRSKTSPAHEKDPTRTLDILSRELRKNPDDKRNQYYMARECLRFEDLAGAVYWFERRCVDIDWTNEQADALFLLGDCYSKLGRGKDAVNAWIKVILINPEFKAAYESLAKSFQGPNRNKWMELAKIAKNTNLLFLR